MRQESVFKALADRHRRRVLRLLRRGALSAGAIAEHFDFTKASLSHHLALLRQAELVRVTRRGQQRIYALNTSVVEEALGFLMNILDDTEKDGE